MYINVTVKTRFHTSNTAKVFMRFNLDGLMAIWMIDS